MANPIRCHKCGGLIIERAAAPWRYTCRTCGSAESSTGYQSGPTKYPYLGKRAGGQWENRYRRAS